MHEKRFSGEVDRLRSPDRIERLQVEKVVDRCLEGLASPSVLDVGTGTGLFAEGFVKRGCRVEGVDANPEMIVHAQRLIPDARFVVGTAEKLPYPDGTFDLVFLGLVFHETDDAEAALRTAVRVARKRIAILEWPYREQEFGPPLPHRIEPERLAELFAAAAGRQPTVTSLANLDLIVLDKEPSGR